MIDEKRHAGNTPVFPYEEDGRSHRVTDGVDVFGNEENHQIKYKTLSWQLVAVLMIAEIVSNGMLSLPSSGGVVGVGHQLQILDGMSTNIFQQLVPNVILIVVCTSYDRKGISF